MKWLMWTFNFVPLLLFLFGAFLGDMFAGIAAASKLITWGICFYYLVATEPHMFAWIDAATSRASNEAIVGALNKPISIRIREPTPQPTKISPNLPIESQEDTEMNVSEKPKNDFISPTPPNDTENFEDFGDDQMNEETDNFMNSDTTPEDAFSLSF